jgi:thioredoxin reductase (NADPH)
LASAILDLIIIGGGPAGLTAAIYAARMGMKMLLLESTAFGGRALLAPWIDNYPGFPEGLTGTNLIDRMVEQTKKSGVETITPMEALDIGCDGQTKKIMTHRGEYQASSIILATGTYNRRLQVPGENEFLGQGVSYCAVCDGPFFKGKVTAVIGSSDEALEDALYLSSLSKKVVVITQQKEVVAPKNLLDAVTEKRNTEVHKARVKSIHGDKLVSSILVSDFNGIERTLAVDGIFISLGGIPLSGLAKKIGIELDEKGCIIVDRRQATNVEGIFAAGDCTCAGMQIVTACGEGARAALQAYQYVRSLKRT